MSNVFGTPILDGDRHERVVEAMKKQYDGRDKEAKKYVDKEKREYGNGISVLVLIYNATGETVTFVNSNDWAGRNYDDSYPTVIHNGQWGAFLHTKAPVTATGSEGAVVYRAKNLNNDHSEILFAWEDPWVGSNHVYTEISNENSTYDWTAIEKTLENSSMANSAAKDGLLSVVNITQNTSPYLIVQFFADLMKTTTGEDSYKGSSWTPLQIMI